MKTAKKIQRKVSGPELIAMVCALEAFVIALAAEEAKSRPDPKAFLTSLRAEAGEAADRYDNATASSYAQTYADELVAAIAEGADISLKEEKKPEAEK